jgi:hypothetical protein
VILLATFLSIRKHPVDFLPKVQTAKFPRGKSSSH